MGNSIFKIYQVGNLGATKNNIFVGNTYFSEINKNKNNFSTFLFASLVGGRNVRIDQPTEKDPYIFIDSRFYTFKPFNYYVQFNNGTTLSSLENNFPDTTSSFEKTIIKDLNSNANGDIVVSIKNLKVDSKFTFYKNKTNDEIIIKAAEYNLKNINENKVIKILDRKSKDGYGNTNFHMKKLIEGNCLKLEQILEFTWENVFSSSSSSSSSFSLSFSSQSSLSSQSISSSFSYSLSSLSSPSSESRSSEECCFDCKLDSVVFNNYNISICDYHFDPIENKECSFCEDSPREFVEKYYKIKGHIQCTGNEPYEGQIIFPDNIYSPTFNNNFWRYIGTTYPDKETSIVKYDLVVNNSFTSGINLSKISYTKKKSNLVQHDLTFTTPSSASETFTALNNLTTTIPNSFLNQSCYGADFNIDNTIFDAVENLLSFTLDTAFSNPPNVIYAEYQFPSDISSGIFIRDSIVNLNGTTKKVIYKIEDNAYNSGSTDGILEIEVTLCALPIQSYISTGSLELTVKICCDNNNFNSDYSEESLVSGESLSSISDLSSHSSSSQSSKSNSSDSSEGCILTPGDEFYVVKKSLWALDCDIEDWVLVGGPDLYFTDGVPPVANVEIGALYDSQFVYNLSNTIYCCDPKSEPTSASFITTAQPSISASSETFTIPITDFIFIPDTCGATTFEWIGPVSITDLYECSISGNPILTGIIPEPVDPQIPPIPNQALIDLCCDESSSSTSSSSTSSSSTSSSSTSSSSTSSSSTSSSSTSSSSTSSSSTSSSSTSSSSTSSSSTSSSSTSSSSTSSSSTSSSSTSSSSTSSSSTSSSSTSSSSTSLSSQSDSTSSSSTSSSSTSSSSTSSSSTSSSSTSSSSTSSSSTSSSSTSSSSTSSSSTSSSSTSSSSTSSSSTSSSSSSSSSTSSSSTSSSSTSSSSTSSSSTSSSSTSSSSTSSSSTSSSSTSSSSTSSSSTSSSSTSLSSDSSQSATPPCTPPYPGPADLGWWSGSISCDCNIGEAEPECSFTGQTIVDINNPEIVWEAYCCKGPNDPYTGVCEYTYIEWRKQ